MAEVKFKDAPEDYTPAIRAKVFPYAMMKKLAGLFHCLQHKISTYLYYFLLVLK